MFFLHWPILEDLFYKKKNRFYFFTDLISIMGECRRGSTLIVTDDAGFSPCDEEDGIVFIDARPGNTLDGWQLVRSEDTHRFSKGERNIYVYQNVMTFDSGTMQMMEEMRDDEEDEQKRLRQLEEDMEDE